LLGMDVIGAIVVGLKVIEATVLGLKVVGATVVGLGVLVVGVDVVDVVDALPLEDLHLAHLFPALFHRVCPVLIIYPSQSREIPNREGIPCTFDDEGPDEAESFL
jgi:hypothetical protein